MKGAGKANGKASPGSCKGIKDLADTKIHSCEDFVGEHGDFVHKKSRDVVPNSL